MENTMAPPRAAENTRDCAALDGVWYARFQKDGALWRMGATAPDWEQRLPGSADPDRETLLSLAGRGVWLERDKGGTPPLAVMCCGQGSIWPGMGRELYDSFPEARAAMDRLAACSNWDVLALMDEPSVETIGLTQWAQPYLFLLEYAQFSLLMARGLSPACICGHSLGELVALCLAGVYSPETCWYILETRSRHVAELEARSRRDTGMMGVYAGMDEVAPLLEQWPDLRISNCNTPTQYILSGPKEALKEARRQLRRRRVPAVILNIALAFHHPGMRVLRDMDWQRLMMLEMHPSSTPMLSCVTADDYPRDQAGICTAIMDLDENAVNWVGSVNALWQQRGIRHFLELGPQDTLCGLTEAVQHKAVCLACSSRGRERDAMRQTLARLHAMGHLRYASIQRAAAGAQPLPPAAARPELKDTEAGAASETVGIPELRDLLARACGRSAEALRGSMDLRFDLHLRSSCFPSLIEEARAVLGVEAAFEDLLNVSTIADLERVFSPDRAPVEDGAVYTPPGADVERPFTARCEAGAPDGGLWRELPHLPARPLPQPGCCAVHGSDDAFCAELVRGLAAFGITFAVDGEMPLTRVAIRAMGSSDEASWQEFCAGGLECGLLVWQGACGIADAGRLLRLAKARPARCILVADTDDSEGLSCCMAVPGRGVQTVGVLCGRWPGDTAPAARTGYGDLLLRELRAMREGGATMVRWAADSRVRLLVQPMLDAADDSPVVFPASRPVPSRRTACTVWNAQFSPELYPGLEALPADDGGWRSLPLSLLLEAQRQAALLASPGLACAGFIDIRLQGACMVRRGLVRELRMTADLRPWMNHERVMTRMARIRSELRDMSRDGRSARHYTAVGESSVLLVGRDPQVQPLWSPAAPGSGRPVDCAAWYDAQGYGSGRRWLEQAWLDEAQGMTAVLDQSVFLALQGVWPYTSHLACGLVRGLEDGAGRHLCAFEAVMQAVGLIRAVDMPRTLCENAPGFIGFVRFGSAQDGPFVLHIRRQWDQDRVLRYDAQVTGADGSCLLAVNHIEFNELPQDDSGRPDASATPQGE